MTALREELLPFLKKPARYLGTEFNAVHKELEGKVKVALAYPDLYEIGMSHLGLQILYGLLNAREDVACERVFAPGLDLEEELRKRGWPLFSLESALPLKEFDILGFSLQYELTFTNLLNMLDLAGIPIYACERDGTFPLILGGGPIAFNPEPLADFFDAFYLGDGEEGIGEIIDCFISWKKSGAPKGKLLEELAEIPGIYVPSLFKVSYYHDGRIKEIAPVKPGYERVTKRILPELEKAWYPARSVVPFMRTVHDRLSLEIARGCTKGCRFCQAGMIYLPLRERSPGLIKEMAEACLSATGYEELSLLSLSTGDYSALNQLLPLALNISSRWALSLSVPSLRVGSLSPALIQGLRPLGPSSFTLAPEAGSERLRRAINKGMSEEEILAGAEMVLREGASLKLYFMIGLPFEEEEDVEEIVRLGKKLGQIARRSGPGRRVKVSVSSFVPKAHTPFQWCPFGPLSALTVKQSLLRRGLKGERLEYKWHDLGLSRLEAIFARGDRRLGAVLANAFRLGCRFDGWGEMCHLDLWEAAFQEAALDPDFYLGPRQQSEVLPWDHLDCGVTKEFLWEEFSRAEQGLETSDCTIAPCHLCGVCDQELIKNRLARDQQILPQESPRAEKGPFAGKTPQFRVRFRFIKVDAMRYLSHLEMVNVFIRGLRRARVPVAHSQGFHPRPKLIFATALPVGLESLDEWADVELYRPLAASQFLDKMNGELPEGLRIVQAFAAPLLGKSLAAAVAGDLYWAFINSDLMEDWEDKIAGFWQKDAFLFYRERKEKGEEVDLKSFVTELKLAPGARVEFKLCRRNGLAVKPWEVLAQIFGLSHESVKGLKLLKAETIFASKETAPLRMREPLNIEKVGQWQAK